jgi:hypothetical protein
MEGVKAMRSISISNEAYARLEAEVWEIATDDSYLPERWDTVYETPTGRLFVCSVDEIDGKITRHILTKKQLVAAYVEHRPTHCGGADILRDPDACSADILLQLAVFGEVIYG